MANLIPPDAKKEIKIQYWLRVITVWLVLVGCALIVIAILKVPTFLLVQAQLGSFSGAYDEALVKEDSFASVQKTIKEANDLAIHLSEYTPGTNLSAIVEVLDTVAGSDVLISEFQFEKSEGVITKINVSGLASTRSSLANFSTDLETHSLFTNAELPISNLAKDKDIAFNIAVTPAIQE